MGRGPGPKQRAILNSVEAGRPFPLHGRDRQDTSNLRKSAAVLAARGKLDVIRVPGDALGELVYAVPVGYRWPHDQPAPS